MNQIKTYSKSRPKSVAIQGKDDTIFEASESESDEGKAKLVNISMPILTS